MAPHRIDILRQLPLEPMEYCRRWVPDDPNRNHRKACIHASSMEFWEPLSRENPNKFLQLGPDVASKLVSESDEVKTSGAKMDKSIEE